MEELQYFLNSLDSEYLAQCIKHKFQILIFHIGSASSKTVACLWSVLKKK